MRSSEQKRAFNLGVLLLGGVSAFALAQPAIAQSDADSDGQVEEEARQDVVVVTGIRKSLQASSDIKRDAQVS